MKMTDIFALHRKGYGFDTVIEQLKPSRADTTICSCCGSRYKPTPKSNKVTITGGITVYSGIVGKEVSNEYQEIKHIKTRNGDLTIGVKTKWGKSE